MLEFGKSEKNDSALLFLTIPNTYLKTTTIPIPTYVYRP